MDLPAAGSLMSAGFLILLTIVVVGVVTPAVWSRNERRRKEAVHVLSLMLTWHRHLALCRQCEEVGAVSPGAEDEATRIARSTAQSGQE